MHDSSLIWRKHGDIFAHECTPQWRFEGKAVFHCDIRNRTRWQSDTNRAYTRIENLEGVRSLGNWDSGPGQVDDGHQKCLSGGTIRKILFVNNQNTIPHRLHFSLIKDQFTEVKQYFTLEASSPLHAEEIDTFDPLIFDHLYSYAFTTDDGDIPDKNNINRTMSAWISTEIWFGGGDS